MTIDQFNQAKLLREKIAHLKTKKVRIQSMKKRDDDADFNMAHELAHDYICYVIEDFERKFNDL